MVNASARENMPDFPLTTSFWFEPDIEVALPLAGTQYADVAIVGGGFAGLSAACHLKSRQPELSVALVEAEHIGYGASGRNAGWVMSLPPLYWLLDNLQDRQRLADIQWVSQYCRDNIAEVGQLVRREAIDCDWTPSQHVLTARNPIEAATLRWVAPRFEAIGQNCEFLDKGKLKQVVSYPLTAAMAYEIVTIQPYRLARGLRRHCLNQGVQIYENTRVTQIRHAPQEVRLATAAGATLTAGKVILATNAYLGSVETDVELPAASRHHTYMLATAPLDPDMIDRISSLRKPFGDASLAFYIGRIHQNRLIFNGIDRASRATSEDDRHLPSFRKLYGEMIRRFPLLAALPLAGAWGGAVQQTSTDAPIIRSAKNAPNVILNIGYGGGSGVGMALLSGRLTVDLVLENAPIDRDVQRLRTLLANSRFPRMGPVRAAAGVLKHLLFG